MDKKNLMSQVAQPVGNFSIEDMPIELAELSEENLSQVWGGWRNLPNLDDVVVGQLEPPELCCFCWSPPEIPIRSQSINIDGRAIYE